MIRFGAKLKMIFRCPRVDSESCHRWQYEINNFESKYLTTTKWCYKFIDHCLARKKIQPLTQNFVDIVPEILPILRNQTTKQCAKAVYNYVTLEAWVLTSCWRPSTYTILYLPKIPPLPPKKNQPQNIRKVIAFIKYIHLYCQWGSIGQYSWSGKKREWQKRNIIQKRRRGQWCSKEKVKDVWFSGDHTWGDIGSGRHLQVFLWLQINQWLTTCIAFYW